MKAITTAAVGSFAFGIFAAEIPKAPVPPSPYLLIIYKYADAMLERGRGTNGMLYSALDRATLTPLTNRPPAPAGVHERSRIGQGGGALIGSSPDHHQNLLRLLYMLSDLSGKPKYRAAADTELRWLLENADERYLSGRLWMLWDRCFDLAPEPTQRFAAPQGEHHPTTEVPRFAGFSIRTWAVAHARTTNELYLKAIDDLTKALLA